MGDKSRETVIKALECCIFRHPDDKLRCVSCPYKDPESYCLNRLKMDALELLKAQETKKPNCEAANHDGGGCLGYGHSESDDEPIEACKDCIMYTGNREGR